MRRLVMLVVCLSNLAFPAMVHAAYPADFDTFKLPGHWYSQASGTPESHLLGYPVLDTSRAKMWTTFQRLGGVNVLGYPVSGPYDAGGFEFQAFQKAILQLDSAGHVQFVNAFDQLHDAGKDALLQNSWQIPPQLPTTGDRGLSWDQVVAAHQSLLSGDSAIRAAYAADPDPISHFGLPMSASVDQGPFVAVRCQRAVFQRWKQAEPWAAAGQVTLVNGGDIVKAAGLLPKHAGDSLLPSFAFVPGGPYRHDANDVDVQLEDLPSGFARDPSPEGVVGPHATPLPGTPSTEPTPSAEKQAARDENGRIFAQLEAHGFVNAEYPTFVRTDGIDTSIGPVVVYAGSEVFQGADGAQWEYGQSEMFLTGKVSGVVASVPTIGDETAGLVGHTTLPNGRQVTVYSVTYRAGNVVNGVLVYYAGAPGSLDLAVRLAQATLGHVTAPIACPQEYCGG